MELKEFAKMFNGCEENEIDANLAKENGFVVVFGQSDDIMSFIGMIYDEGNCNNGGIVEFSKKGTIQNPEEVEEAIEILKDNGFDIESIKSNLNQIRALWCPDEVFFNGEPISGFSWDFKTDIPHEKFKIYEDGEVYSAGIVFKFSDLK